MLSALVKSTVTPFTVAPCSNSISVSPIVTFAISPAAASFEA